MMQTGSTRRALSGRGLVAVCGAAAVLLSVGPTLGRQPDAAATADHDPSTHPSTDPNFRLPDSVRGYSAGGVGRPSAPAAKEPGGGTSNPFKAAGPAFGRGGVPARVPNDRPSRRPPAAAPAEGYHAPGKAEPPPSAYGGGGADVPGEGGESDRRRAGESDRRPAGARQTFVYQLRYLAPDEAIASVTPLLSLEGRAAIQDAPDRAVSWVPGIVVSDYPDKLDRIRQALRQADRPRPPAQRTGTIPTVQAPSRLPAATTETAGTPAARAPSGRPAAMATTPYGGNGPDSRGSPESADGMLGPSGGRAEPANRGGFGGTDAPAPADGLLGGTNTFSPGDAPTGGRPPVIVLVTVTPENLKQAGFSVATARRDDGTVDVTVARVLKPRPFRADFKTDRSATVTVSGSAGVVMRCRLEPESHSGMAVVYRCDVAPAQAAHTQLDLVESAKERGRDAGTTIHRLRLQDFLKE